METTVANAPRVLIVEDDPELGPSLRRGLTEAGYDASWVSDGPAALHSAARDGAEIAVLDVNLPGMSGFELCRRLREADAAMSIIMLTARDGIEDRVRGLDAGADDYLAKPFSFVELSARLRALRRRVDGQGAPTLRLGAVVIDSLERRVEVGGEAVSLSPKEFDVLRLLAQRLGETVERGELLLEVWGTAEHVNPNIVDQYVSYLRRKLAPLDTGLSLRTVRGIGFSLSHA